VRGAGASAAAERLLCRFVRQGLEVLTAAALVDYAEVVRHVALNFTGVLLRSARGAGPCPGLEQRCQSLLEALAEVPKNFRKFLHGVNNKLEDQAASEWRGCNEGRSPAAQAAAAEAAQAEAAPQQCVAVATVREDEPACDGEHAAPPEPPPPAPAAKSDPFAAAVSAFAAKSAKAEPKAGPAARADPFAAAVAAFTAAGGQEEGYQPKVSAALDRTQLVPVAAPTAELQKCPVRESDEASAYHATEEWGKLRAHCVRIRLCVNFNRDSADRRCTAPSGSCSFKHACAVCGAEERGGPGAQYQCHGGWNCPGLAAWLMVHR